MITIGAIGPSLLPKYSHRPAPSPFHPEYMSMYWTPASYGHDSQKSSNANNRAYICHSRCSICTFVPRYPLYSVQKSSTGLFNVCESCDGLTYMWALWHQSWRWTFQSVLHWRHQRHSSERPEYKFDWLIRERGGGLDGPSCCSEPTWEEAGRRFRSSYQVLVLARVSQECSDLLYLVLLTTI